MAIATITKKQTRGQAVKTLTRKSSPAPVGIAPSTPKRTNDNLLLKIYQEVKELRKELREDVFWLTRPEEDLEDYAHPDRIKRSLKETLKERSSRV
jgi:hypothetical protein